VGRAHPTCLDMMSLVFRGLPFSSIKSLVAQAFQPVPAQAKACGYILSIYPLNTECKIPAGHYWDLWGFQRIIKSPLPPLEKGGIKMGLKYGANFCN